MGDVFFVQEAHGLEEDGAIAIRLREHGIQTTYFQKGKAPPLAVLVKGPTAADINGVIPQARQISGQTPNSDLEVHVAIISSDTTPWGGVEEFCTKICERAKIQKS